MPRFLDSQSVVHPLIRPHRSEQKSMLLEPQFAAALAGLVQGAAGALSGGRQPLSEAHAASLEAVVFMMGDLVDWTGPEPGVASCRASKG